MQELWEGDMALTVAKSLPAGLHLSNTLTGEMITGENGVEHNCSIINGCDTYRWWDLPLRCRDSHKHWLVCVERQRGEKKTVQWKKNVVFFPSLNSCFILFRFVVQLSKPELSGSQCCWPWSALSWEMWEIQRWRTGKRTWKLEEILKIVDQDSKERQWDLQVL